MCRYRHLDAFRFCFHHLHYFSFLRIPCSIPTGQKPSLTPVFKSQFCSKIFKGLEAPEMARSALEVLICSRKRQSNYGVNCNGSSCQAPDPNWGAPAGLPQPKGPRSSPLFATASPSAAGSGLRPLHFITRLLSNIWNVSERTLNAFQTCATYQIPDKCLTSQPLTASVLP